MIITTAGRYLPREGLVGHNLGHEKHFVGRARYLVSFLEQLDYGSIVDHCEVLKEKRIAVEVYTCLRIGM